MMRNFVLLAGLLCVFCGCGPGGNTVTGKVTLDDGSAAPRGQVTLMGGGATYHGAIAADGVYTITGIAAGDYQVAVTGVDDREQTDDQAGMEFDDETGEYTDTDVESPVSLIKDIYFNPTVSGLSITVPSDSYDLELERAAGAAPAVPAETE